MATEERAKIDAGVADVSLTNSGGEPERVNPEFAARLRAIWGEKVYPSGTATGWVRDDRDARG